jgi:WD40 repeat protein
MPRLLLCPSGHQWEATDDEATACPICGSAGARDTGAIRPTIPPADESSTVAFSPAWQAMPPLHSETPPSLPDFEILGEVGRGGMGVVYKARQRADDRLVALKVIRKDRLLDEEAVRRFRREAQAAARANHRNIVRVLDSDHSGDTHYLVMEYVDGITLQRLVEQHGPLPVEQACDFIRQAALGLQHAQEQSLVHRDIKPSNLMVSVVRGPSSVVKDNQDSGATSRSSTDHGLRTTDSLLKILDLGVARLLPPGGGALAESLTTLTQGGSVIGTADYIAPEQLEDPHGADIRADLYSLGCTFYFLLTGQVPFPGGTLISKLDKQRWQSPPPINLTRPEIPAGVASIVQKLMAKKPVDRYQSPAEVARVLDAMARAGYRGGGAPLLALVRRLTGHTEAVWAACFSPDGRHIGSAGKDGRALLWQANDGTQLRELPKHSQEVRALAYPGEPGRLVSASGLTLRLWDLETAGELRRFSGHASAVRCVGICEEGQRLLSGAEDRTVRVWEMQTGREVLRFSRHTAGVTCVAAVPGTKHAVSGGRDHTLRVWDLASGKEIHVFAPGGGAVLAVAVSPDGRRAASAHFDTVIRLWELDTATELRKFEGHRQMVTSLAFTPDGRWLMSASQDQTVRLWDVETAYELSSVRAGAGGINAVAISPDGRLALAAGSEGSVCVYEVGS